VIPLSFLVLVGSGLAWGATIALSKVAVSTGHGTFGLIQWQLGVGALLMGAVCLVRRRPLPLTRASLTFAVVVALLGTLLPNAASYSAYRHLPAGVMAIIIALVPMLSFGLALILRQDRATLLRVLGLSMGLAGVVVIALPGAGAGVAVGWVLIAVIAPVLYAGESNFVAGFGTAGLDPVQALFLASVAGFVLCLPLSLGFGQWINPLDPWGAAEGAITLSSVLHVFAYASYVWLAATAGATFAAQSAYVVTASGVFWGAVLLGERITPTVTLALALLLAGVALVRPREQQRTA
jgi:drug/metabolite transporter (DMT)-like permease